MSQALPFSCGLLSKAAFSGYFQNHTIPYFKFPEEIVIVRLHFVLQELTFFLFSGTVKSRLNISKLFLPIMRFISHYTIVLWLNYILFCDGKYKVNIIPVSYQVEFILKLFSFMTNEGMLRYLSTVCRWSDKKKNNCVMIRTKSPASPRTSKTIAFS